MFFCASSSSFAIVTIVVCSRKENAALSKEKTSVAFAFRKGSGLWVIVVKVNALCVYFIIGGYPVPKYYNWTYIPYNKSAMWPKFLEYLQTD